MKKRTLENMRTTLVANGEGTITSYNISEVLTTLIKASARCDHHSSDILYDIEELNENIKNSKPGESKTQYFGIREHGVDGMNFITSREMEYPYIVLYRAKIINSYDFITVSLYKLTERK